MKLNDKDLDTNEQDLTLTLINQPNFLTVNNKPKNLNKITFSISTDFTKIYPLHEHYS